MTDIDRIVDALYAEHAPPPADPLDALRLAVAHGVAAPGATVTVSADLVRLALTRLDAAQAAQEAALAAAGGAAGSRRLMQLTAAVVAAADTLEQRDAEGRARLGAGGLSRAWCDAEDRLYAAVRAWREGGGDG